MEEQLKDIVNTVLENRGKNKIDKLTDNDHLRNDIGFDSLDLAELTVRIEERFGIDVFQDGIISTFSEIKEKLQLRK